MSERMVVKARLEIKEIRRLEIKKEEATLEDLRTSLALAFPVLNLDQAELTFYWKDSDGDDLNLYSDGELRNAINNVIDGTLRLTIKVTPKLQKEYKSSKACSLQTAASQDVSSPSDISLRVGITLKDVTDSKCEVATDDSLFGEPLSEEAVSSTTLNQYAGQYTAPGHDNVSTCSQWPNAETCDLVRIKKYSLKRLPSVSLLEAYPVRECQSGNRGHVVIINNSNIKGMPKISGTDNDATCLHEVFKMMKFSIKSYSNRTSKQLYDDLGKEYMHLKNNGHQYDIFILIIMGYCHGNCVFGIDGYNPDGPQFWQILDGFNNMYEFKGKPKIIISEGCKRETCSTDRQATMEHTLQKTETKMPEIGQVYVTGARDEVDAKPMKTELEDIFFYAGCTYGSNNKHVKGSLMLQALKDVFLEHAKDESLQEMIPQVEEKLRLANVAELQLPMIVKNTLAKKVFLF